MPKSAFPHWIYDGSPIDDPFGYGQDAVDFIHAIRHPASTAPQKQFQLFDPFERMTRAIFGPRNPDGTRKIKTAFLMLGRGNRKTSHAAAWSLLHLIGPEADDAGQVIFAACDREQASIGFREAANIIRMDKRLMAATRINDAFNSAKQIKNLRNMATLKAVSSDGRAQHGTTPTFILADEIHKWKGREMWEALISGMVKAADPLMIICTTAGRGRENIGFEQYDYARRVAIGEIDDPTFLPLLFELEDGDDWEDEANWPKANPGLPYGFPNIDGLRNFARKAKHSPPAQYEFQQLSLNMWMAASRDPLFDMAVYDAGHIPFDDDEIADLPAYVGVDMSVNGDLTAVVIAWKHKDGRVFVRPHFFIPGDDLEARSQRDGVPYARWRDENLITAIDGPIIEPEIVEKEIREIAASYDVREIAFDPALARRPMQHLADEGLPVVEFRQTITNMGPAIGDLERTVNGFKIRHNGHPILRHHFDSVVASRNDTGLTRMHKAKRTDRIDGAVAAAMAVSRAVANDNLADITAMDPEAFARVMGLAA
jgi:phage terminase large subunit-like protein